MAGTLWTTIASLLQLLQLQIVDEGVNNQTHDTGSFSPCLGISCWYFFPPLPVMIYTYIISSSSAPPIFFGLFFVVFSFALVVIVRFCSCRHTHHLEHLCDLMLECKQTSEWFWIHA
mmetsp:Transcript_5295/g.9196  ORF Transcript_5295/g.9196 Transcript_5295/m.9196 type:complete len:117 (-) Transcript_5295:200-550(-)